MTPSISEKRGLQAIKPTDLRVYSVGISTAGNAEIGFEEQEPRRTIIATTIDQEGLLSAKARIAKSGSHGQITVKLEDVSQPLPYDNGKFDFIYARLVLHYLPRKDLQKALSEFNRILKPTGRLFVVVRSDQCPDAVRSTSTYDDETGMTTFISKPNKEALEKTMSRYFHSETSLRNFVEAVGFRVESLTSYNENLFDDFNRSIDVDHQDNLIELIATKK